MVRGRNAWSGQHTRSHTPVPAAGVTTMTREVMESSAASPHHPAMDTAAAQPSPAPARPAGPPPSFVEQLRHWRQGRGIRQLSCGENGRCAPSREMVPRLAERLDVPLRERNALLGATGYAPR
jgi:hypothetical protein